MTISFFMIETDRLRIQQWSEDDSEVFFQLTQDTGFNQFPITQWQQKSIESARAWIQQNNVVFQKTKTGAFAVWDRSTDQVVGMVALRLWDLETEQRYEV